jgi:predicted nucleic acid-binding protein
VEGAELAVTEHVVLEVLAGARSQRHLRELRSQLLAFPVLQLEGLADYEEAAEIYRACRTQGETIRKLGDCLVAVPVIREGAELLHNDSDFDAIARHSELRIYSP